MKTSLRALALLLVLGALAACNKDLSPLNTAAQSIPQPTATTYNPCTVAADPYMWFDFETDPANYWWWPGGPTVMTQSWSSSVAHTGCHSWKLVTGAGVGYGHWNGLTMTVPPGNAAGANNLEISVNIDTTLTTTLYIDEGTSNGGQGQDWSRTVTFANNPSWVTYTYPLSSFTTSDPGDGIVNTQDVIQIWYYHSAPYSKHTLYIDDIRFTP